MQSKSMTDLQRRYMLKVMKINLDNVNKKKWNSADAKARNILFSNECIASLENMTPTPPPQPRIDKVVLMAGDKVIDTLIADKTPSLEGL